jgi:sulfonate transport system permease protein
LGKDEPVALSEHLTGTETVTEAAKPASAAGGWGWLLGLVVPVGLALGWEFAVAFGFANGRLLPPPSRVLGTLWQLARSGDLTVHVLATVWRIALGFLFGVIAGTALGALTGY